jgi:hypothetical protein
VKAGRRLFRLEDGDVFGQRGVERLREARHRWAALGVEARDLPGRMDAGIGPARDGEAAPGRQHGIERLAQRALDRPLAGCRAQPRKRSRRTRASVSDRHAMLLTQVASAQPPSHADLKATPSAP